MMQFFTATQPYFASHFHFSANGIFMAAVHLSLRDEKRKRDRSLTVITANRFFGQNYWRGPWGCNNFKTKMYGRGFGKAQPFPGGHTAPYPGNLRFSQHKDFGKQHSQSDPSARHHRN